MQSGEISLVCSRITVVKDRLELGCLDCLSLKVSVAALKSIRCRSGSQCSEVLTVLEWCAYSCPFWGLLWWACSEPFVTRRGWLQTCLWIARYNSQDETVLCYTQQFVQRHQTEMLSYGAMRVYENSSSCKCQQHVDPWTTCWVLCQDSSQLKMEWLCIFKV